MVCKPQLKCSLWANWSDCVGTTLGCSSCPNPSGRVLLWGRLPNWGSYPVWCLAFGYGWFLLWLSKWSGSYAGFAQMSSKAKLKKIKYEREVKAQCIKYALGSVHLVGLSIGTDLMNRWSYPHQSYVDSKCKLSLIGMTMGTHLIGYP